jgi:hypothetical protein
MDFAMNMAARCPPGGFWLGLIQLPRRRFVFFRPSCLILGQGLLFVNPCFTPYSGAAAESIKNPAWGGVMACLLLFSRSIRINAMRLAAKLLPRAGWLILCELDEN